MIINGPAGGRPALFVLRTPRAGDLVSYYSGLFGWEAADLGDGIRSMSVGGRPVAVIRPGDGGWLPFLAVPDLAWAVNLAVKQGATIQEETTSDVTGTHAVIVDPTATPLGLWEVGSGSGVGRMLDPGSVAWIEQKTRQQGAATEFLTALFGYAVAGPEGPGAVRVLIPADKPVFGGVMQFDGRWADDYPAHWLLYVAVDDLDDTIAEAVSRGGSLWFEPTATPLGPLAYIQDPAGHAIAVVSVSPGGHAMIGG